MSDPRMKHTRFLAPALALLCACLLGVTPANPHLSAQDAAGTVPGLESTCVDADSDDSGVIRIISKCSEEVEAVWYFGAQNMGYATIEPGKSADTGVLGSQIAELGALRIYACPSSHPVPIGPDGSFVSAPVESYRCSVNTARENRTGKPAVFHYNALTSGDCVLEKGSLSFTASGDGKWEATIHTNRTMNRDIWHMAFDVVDSNGRPLFPVRPGDSPAMYGSPSPRIPWAVPFNFDPAKFRYIADVRIRMSC